jgi:hypothetical protein
MAMQNRISLARNGVWLRWTLAALLAVTVIPGTAFGATRVVLGDEFTATW